MSAAASRRDLVRPHQHTARADERGREGEREKESHVPTGGRRLALRGRPKEWRETSINSKQEVGEEERRIPETRSLLA
jgi:hypothetical protein